MTKIWGKGEDWTVIEGSDVSVQHTSCDEKWRATESGTMCLSRGTIG